MAFLTMTRRETLRRAIHEILPVLMSPLRDTHSMFWINSLTVKSVNILWFSFCCLVHLKPIADLVDAGLGDFIDVTPLRGIFLSNIIHIDHQQLPVSFSTINECQSTEYAHAMDAVSYTHLTLPTILLV